MAEPENFDALYNGNRAFILGGITFHWEPVHWREWGDVIDARVAEEEEKEKRRKVEMERLVAEGMEATEAEVQADENIDDSTLVQTYERVIDRCLVYVANGEAESFKAVINDPEKRISVAQLNALAVWLQEVQTPDRPTTTPSASSPGAGSTGAISPAA
jgi:hypothetical protein